MEENVLTLDDYLSILNRRKWVMIIPFFLIASIVGITALLLPAVYRSTATLLIEQREISDEYVTDSMTSYAEQRIESIRQRVLTSKQLQELIKQFNLYPELRKKKSMDEIVSIMRNKISVKPVNVKVVDRRSGSTKDLTIAFRLSYEGNNPGKIQQVVNTITTLFLKADLDVRTEQASSTYGFLQGERERIKERLYEYERELAVFKKDNANSLPGMFQLNMQALNDIQMNVQVEKENLRTFKEKAQEVEEQLNNTPVDLEAAMESLGQRNEDESRLETLNMELINLKTRFTDQYPDVKKLKQEIAKLSKEIETKKKENELKNEGEKLGLKNPTYVTLSSRLAALRFDIGSSRNRIEYLEKQEEVFKKRLAATPGVEEKYNVLVAEKNNLQIKYNEMQAKMMEAKIAEALVSKQKGERFTLIESGKRPGKPFKPNRLAVALVGIIMGLGTGIGLAAVLEFSDTSFRNADSLARYTGFPVLTVIPKIVTREDRKKRFMVRAIVVATAVVFVVVLVVLFDNYVMDLDVVWAKIMRRIS